MFLTPYRRLSPMAMFSLSALFFTVYAVVLLRIQVFLNSKEQTLAQTNSVQRPSSANGVRISIPKYMPVRLGTTTEKSVGTFARPTGKYNVLISDIWESSGSLPSWMKDYFRWHKEVRSSLSFDNWKEQRYLILQCHEKSTKCGGTADRLSALPFLLRLAARSHRLLLVYWGRPCELENFLLPPVGGMDWRVPNLLKDKLFSDGKFGATEDDLLFLVDSESTVVRCRFQSASHGAAYYDRKKLPREKSFSAVTRDIWQVLFTPSSPISTLIVAFLNESHLKPGRYVGAHLRALYGVKDREPALVHYWSQNAVNCSSQLGRHLPIFFAADNLAASILASRYGDSTGVRVVSRRHYKTEPLHLDKATDWRNRKPSEYYDAFVDLYLLAMSQCVAYGMGGFGRFASWLSFNSSCAMQHHSALGVTPCTLAMLTPHEEEGVVEKTLFFDPMPTRNELPSEKS